MKNTFILRTNYDDLFQELTPLQAGEVIQAVFALVNKRQLPSFTSESARILFKCIQKDIMYDLEKYEQARITNIKNGKKGGRPRKTQKTQGLSSQNQKAKTQPNPHVDVEMSRDEMSRDENISLTAQAAAAQGERDFSEPKSQTTKTPLQRFSNQVIKYFEPDVKTDAQKGIWFKRNCRCLRDILNFCAQDIPLALQTIHVCLERWEKSGIRGGYEGICRNLPECYAQAQTRMENSPYAHIDT